MCISFTSCLFLVEGGNNKFEDCVCVCVCGGGRGEGEGVKDFRTGGGLSFRERLILLGEGSVPHYMP